MQPNLKIWANIFQKCPTASKLESTRTKIFLQEVDQDFCEWSSICQILDRTLWPVTPPYFLPKRAQLVQNVIAFFPEKGEETEHWFWYLWIVQWLSDRKAGRGVHGGGGGGGGPSRLDQKCKFWVRLVSIKTQILQKYLKQCFCLLECHLWQ